MRPLLVKVTMNKDQNSLAVLQKKLSEALEELDCLAHYQLTARHYESNQRQLNLLKKCSKKDLPHKFLPQII